MKKLNNQKWPKKIQNCNVKQLKILYKSVISEPIYLVDMILCPQKYQNQYEEFIEAKGFEYQEPEYIKIKKSDVECCGMDWEDTILQFQFKCKQKRNEVFKSL